MPTPIPTSNLHCDTPFDGHDQLVSHFCYFSPIFTFVPHDGIKMLMILIQGDIGVSPFTDFQMNLPSGIIVWKRFGIESTQPTHHSGNRTGRKKRGRMAERKTTTKNKSGSGKRKLHTSP